MPTRVVSIENRVFNTFDNRAAALSITSGTVGWIVHTLNTIGSGSVKNLTCVIDGFYKQAGQNEANLPAGMIINKMHLQIVGEPTVPLTMGGSRSYTVTPGEVNTQGDLITAAQLKSILSMLPIGTEFWFKADGTIPWNGALPSSVRHKDDVAGTQFGWYNPANTTLVNGVDVGGPFTWTGTTPDFRNNGWCPWQFVGNYEDGTDPVTEMFVGDSNTQGLQDNTAKRTGRGWPQYLLFGDGTSSPSTGIRSGSNMGISGDSGVSLSTATKIHSKAKYHTDYWVNTGANDLGKAGVGSVTTTHNARMTIKNALIAAWVGSRTPKVIFPQFHPQSTVDSPTKTINSAPNTEWGPGGKASQVNALAAAAVLAGDIYGYAQSPSIRNGNDINDTEYYLWLKNAPPAIGTLLSPDGQHAGNDGVVLIAQDFTPLYRSITSVTNQNFSYVGVGGISMSGAATASLIPVAAGQNFIYVGSGGLLMSGVASIGRAYAYMGSGAFSLSGSADASKGGSYVRSLARTLIINT